MAQIKVPSSNQTELAVSAGTLSSSGLELYEPSLICGVVASLFLPLVGLYGTVDCVVMWSYYFNFNKRTTIICVHLPCNMPSTTTLSSGFYGLISFPLAPRRRKGRNGRPWEGLGMTLKRTIILLHTVFVFQILKIKETLMKRELSLP